MAQGLRIGMDIGGTKVDAVALDDAGDVVARTRTRTVPGAEGIITTAVSVVETLAEEGGCDPSAFVSIGIGIPGRIDRTAGVVKHAYNIGIESLPLARLLGDRVGIPVTVDNDVTAAAVGAAHLMHLSGPVGYLNLGTGLAAGFVLNGKPMRGSHDVAGEIGHLAVDPLGRPCMCGQNGCIETVASGSALKRFWAGAGEHPGQTLLPAVAAGDRSAQEALDNLVRGAASCVRIMALSFDPAAIVVGGGLRLLGDPLFDGITRQLDEWAKASEFLTEIELSKRVLRLADASPAAATGAALSATH